MLFSVIPDSTRTSSRCPALWSACSKGQASLVGTGPQRSCTTKPHLLRPLRAPLAPEELNRCYEPAVGSRRRLRGRVQAYNLCTGCSTREEVNPQCSGLQDARICCKRLPRGRSWGRGRAYCSQHGALVLVLGSGQKKSEFGVLMHNSRSVSCQASSCRPQAAAQGPLRGRGRVTGVTFLALCPSPGWTSAFRIVFIVL